MRKLVSLIICGIVCATLSIFAVYRIDRYYKNDIINSVANYFPGDSLIYAAWYPRLDPGTVSWKGPSNTGFSSEELKKWNDAYNDITAFHVIAGEVGCYVRELYALSGGRIVERLVYPVSYGVRGEEVSYEFVAEYMRFLVDEIRPEVPISITRFTPSVAGLRASSANRYYCLGNAIKDGKVNDYEVKEEYRRLGFNEYYGDSNIRVFFGDMMIDAAYIRPCRVWLRFVDGAFLFFFLFFLIILLRRGK